jgi:hypothetical protein
MGKIMFYSSGIGTIPDLAWRLHYKLQITTPKRETKLLFRAEYFFLLQ